MHLSTLDECGVYERGWQVKSAQNATVTLMREGRERTLMDFMSSFASVNFGHRNPRIHPFDVPVDVVAGCYSPEAETFATWLCTRLGLPEHRVLYQLGGSFAVSTALAMAQHVRPGRVLAVKGAFHGLGADALSVTDVQKGYSLHAHSWQAQLNANVDHVRPGETVADWSRYSCFLFEPVQGANGYVPLPEAWLHEMCKEARRHGVLTVADEIQAGYFRHGHLAVSQSLGLNADVLLFSKSLTNGQVPLSATVYHSRLEPSFSRPVTLAHTFQTLAYGPVAALMTGRFIDEGLDLGRVDALTKRLSALADELRALPRVSDVHVCGPALSFRAGEAGKRLAREGFEAGVLVFTGGANGERVRCAPPLTSTDAELDFGLERLWTVAKRNLSE